MFHKKMQNEICYYERRINNDFANTKFKKAIKTESIKQKSNDHFFFHDIYDVYLFIVNSMGKLSHP